MSDTGGIEVASVNSTNVIVDHSGVDSTDMRVVLNCNGMKTGDIVPSLHIADKSWRIKLYELDSQGTWIDKGTGFVRCESGASVAASTSTSSAPVTTGTKHTIVSTSGRIEILPENESTVIDKNDKNASTDIILPDYFISVRQRPPCSSATADATISQYGGTSSDCSKLSGGDNGAVTTSSDPPNKPEEQSVASSTSHNNANSSSRGNNGEIAQNKEDVSSPGKDGGNSNSVIVNEDAFFRTRVQLDDIYELQGGRLP